MHRCERIIFKIDQFENLVSALDDICKSFYDENPKSTTLKDLRKLIDRFELAIYKAKFSNELTINI